MLLCIGIVSLLHRRVLMTVAVMIGCIMTFSGNSYTRQSVLATGQWVKVSVESTGIHFIPASDLKSIGFNNISAVRVYGYGGRRLPDNIDHESFIDDLPLVQSLNRPEGIYFYAVGSRERIDDINGLAIIRQNPFSDKGFYFLTDNDISALKIKKTGSPGAVAPKTTFTECIHHEKDLVSPGQTGHYMVGEDMRFTPSRRYEFTLTGATDRGLVRVGASLCADLKSGASWNLRAGNATVEVPIPATPTRGEVHGVATEGWTDDFNNDEIGKLNVTLSITGGSGNTRGAWLDWLTVNYERDISLKESPSIVFSSHSREIAISYVSADTKIWDVTDPLDIKEVNLLIDNGHAAFTADNEDRRIYAAFTPGRVSGIPSPKYVERVANQNLHGIDGVDMVIFTSRSFVSAARRLASHRMKHSGLNTTVIVQDDVFNEFASGCRDVGAFRKMLKMLYERGIKSGCSLKYALMIGRGSHDNRLAQRAPSSLNFDPIPLWQSDEGLNDNTSYTSDDPTAMLGDGSDTLSVAIGRIPVTSQVEAETIIDKIINYETNPEPGTWRQRVVVIADDDDDCAHMRQAESHANNLDGSQLLIDKIYIDAYPLTGGVATDAREEFYRSLDEGVAWVTYIGHASTTALSGEGIMNYSDVGSLYLRHVPFIYASTCNFMRWDANAVSGAEMLAATSGGGVIGAISATRPVYIDDNGRLSAHIASEIARDPTVPVGEMLRRAKNRLNGDENKRRYALLGDPAMRLPVATSRVVVDSIPGTDIESDIPVLAARSDVTLCGHIETTSGEKINDWEGDIDVTLYDADESVVTEGRGGSRFTFDRHGLRLAVASGCITNGSFEIKLAMPGNVADNFREATMSLSAWRNNGETAATIIRDFYVGGSDETITDSIAPRIDEIYLNHPSFTDGATVNSAPVLIAEISDDHAINLSMAGVGETMMISIDGGRIVCGDVAMHYTPSSVSSGAIKYQLPELPDGSHSLELSIYDTSGNKAAASMTFNVSHSTSPSLFDIYTSATPANESVRFYIEHDRPDGNMRVTIAVYDIHGRAVWLKTATGRSDMFTTSPVEWNLIDMGGRRVQRGIYIYRAWISERDGISVATPAHKIAVGGS